MTVSEKLRKDGIVLPSPCGSQGRCGKCVVKIKNANPPTVQERMVLGPQSDKGYRLACITAWAEGMEIITDTQPDESRLEILDLYESQSPILCNRDINGYGLAVDIGTTTIAFELADMKTGARAGTYTMVNSQRTYAADVITRIQLASEGQQDNLKNCLLNDICQGINNITALTCVPLHAVRAMAVAGNTTMLHLLLGMPCDSLGKFPFTPVSVALNRHRFAEIFGNSLLDCEILVLPGISAFVGADIVAGLCFCETDTDDDYLFIDLGTNGEMAVVTKDTIFSTSTAAGPAFEAGNIKHGMGSVPGAIAKMQILPDASVQYETIGGRPPLGFCGTGVVDIAASLVKNKMVDETGLLDDKYFDSGFPVTEELVFTQKDLREIQLAKSAVRAGIEILLETAGCGYHGLKKVYLAGGFGHKINTISAEILGIIPPELTPRVIPVGNSALGGCVRALLSAESESAMVSIAGKAREINLSAHPRFNDLFMEHMMFDV
jgi:uncharacterized 2Fe-2S/4Fe-4S cluster protein (DUF4445 family)